jgi:hypothetical protein
MRTNKEQQTKRKVATETPNAKLVLFEFITSPFAKEKMSE